MTKIKLEGNKFTHNIVPKGGDVVVCRDGFAWFVDEDLVLTRLKDGYIKQENDWPEYVIVGRIREIILEENNNGL